jgi:hypothetical protein
MATTNKPQAEVIITDGLGHRIQVFMDLFQLAGNAQQGAEHAPVIMPNGNTAGCTIQLILSPIAGTPTIKQIGDTLHFLRTGVARTTP